MFSQLPRISRRQWLYGLCWGLRSFLRVDPKWRIDTCFRIYTTHMYPPNHVLSGTCRLECAHMHRPNRSSFSSMFERALHLRCSVTVFAHRSWVIADGDLSFVIQLELLWILHPCGLSCRSWVHTSFWHSFYTDFKIQVYIPAWTRTRTVEPC